MIASQLRVKGGGEQRSLLNGDNRTCLSSTAQGREDLNIRATVLHPWRPNEHCAQGPIIESMHIKVDFEGVDLPSEGIATNGHVDAADELLILPRVGDAIGEHDHACAGAEHRES